ncbi:MAG: hypothetical protein R3F61_26305 [Myxococcota bacterium]
MIILLATLAGCQHGLTLPPDDGGGYTGPMKPGVKLKVRPRRHILPGFDSSPAPPEPAIDAQNCYDIDDGGLVNGPDCATATISCGDVIIGHTRGGVDQYSTRFYEKNFCAPALTDHGGGDERVYKLVMPPGDMKAFVYLDSPCADLDLAAVKLNERTCPTDLSIVPQCEMGVNKGTSREKVELVSQRGSTWWLIVEGKDNQEGPFAIHVMCREGLI